MAEPIILNAFTMNTVSHLNYGLWRHPDDQTWRYTDVDYWTDLAKLLDEGGFDTLFIADALGLLDVYGGSAEASLRTGAQSPVNDPLLLVSAMAGATRQLGFGVTVSTTYEHPYLLARKFTTLDHLTKGRVAWNVVTSQLESAARNLGLKQQIAHDDRYEIADEFLEVVYKLWQHSWADDAVRREPAHPAFEGGVYTDPARVRAIHHHGRWFDVPDAHVSAPSPQRVPLLFQAGGSPRGQAFAGRHAEVVFVAGADAAGIRRNVEQIRAAAAASGRDPAALKFISGVNVITAATDEEARSKADDYRQYFNVEGAVGHYSASTGVDFSTQSLDEPVAYRDTNSNRSLLRMFDDPASGRRWTLREALAPRGGFGRAKTLVGGPQRVADELEQWLEATGTDGINLIYTVTPGSFADFIEWVVPVLRQRGRLRSRSGATLRERLFPQGGAYVADDHPAKRVDTSAFVPIGAHAEPVR
ncbi:LLM class flavin-dependent oxidoreductase [Paraburkholderia nodosa]|uniref:LLM class flavin-dependent oxidoreductase n=1 Tax=Paraburkholderia nodosa TaxID=392320 RepID=UPI000841AB54|nr:LLM class flavin-dependent oxidoreductase [Paraburkholderia nodosa]